MNTVFYYAGRYTNDYRTKATHKRAALVVQEALLSRLTNSCRLDSGIAVGRLPIGVTGTTQTHNVSTHGGGNVN